jgi:hypothetical protein
MVPCPSATSQKTGSVSVPRELLREIGVEIGVDSAHRTLNPDVPGTLLLIPSRLVARTMAESLAAMRQLSN